MRVTNAQNYNDPRDAISHDWPRYINYILPKSNYFFIPNLGDDAVDYCKKNKINILILSGGDDIGLFEIRDKTELALLEYMISSKLPVIGICRGMQLIHHHFKGKIVKGNTSFAKNHSATKHRVIINNETIIVNSYHNFKLDESTLNSELAVLARSDVDGSIEALVGPKILGIMWHPERDLNFSQFTKQLIINFLEND